MLSLSQQAETWRQWRASLQASAAETDGSLYPGQSEAKRHPQDGLVEAVSLDQPHEQIVETKLSQGPDQRPGIGRRA